MPVATRLGIYAGAYGARLIEALKANYPALAELLGEEDFEALGAAYVRAHDSPFFSIRYYGDALAALSRRRTPTTRRCALLAELARWEWAHDARCSTPPMPSRSGRGALRASRPRSGRQLRLSGTRACTRLALALERAADLAGAQRWRGAPGARVSRRARRVAPVAAGPAELLPLAASRPRRRRSMRRAPAALRRAVRRLAACTRSARRRRRRRRRRSCAAGSRRGSSAAPPEATHTRRRSTRPARAQSRA